ncbi:16S rRNA (uracil(1498)-N(3))-methyltransferase [Schaalia suimastitidis]|uniref:16S rRNA (uracil(1498)-N(3))-methyltransferase n=1 Tax=Schaalia suimastitidis TaxID=121163 RepID=UPI00040D6801|nr:16S rRNA (uracil(1498)-N(3))-methyltransferase [Schaalia suimastitidis]
MTRPVFLADDLQPEATTCKVGARAELRGDEAHHAWVKRIEVGEQIDVVDGQGLRLTCEVTAIQKSACQLIVHGVVQDSAPVVPLTLVQALAKGGRDEQAVETATEVGIDTVIPWQSHRAIVRWAGPKAEKGAAKWRQVSIAAAKQARRSYLPRIETVVDTDDLCARVARVTRGGGVVFLCHEEACVPLASLLRAESDSLAQAVEIMVIVGPEGGIGPQEYEALVTQGARPIILGPHVLRSSTAGPLATALISAAIGRW